MDLQTRRREIVAAFYRDHLHPQSGDIAAVYGAFEGQQYVCPPDGTLRRVESDNLELPMSMSGRQWSADVAQAYKAGLKDGCRKFYQLGRTVGRRGSFAEGRVFERRYGAMRWTDVGIGVLVGFTLGVLLWLR